MEIRTNMTIGKKLVSVICLLLLFICGGMGFFSYRESSRALQETIEESLSVMSVQAARYIRIRLDNYILGIEGVANRNVIRSMDWEQQRPALENEAQRLGYLEMGIVNQDGSAKYPDGSTTQLGDRQYIRDAFTGKSVVSDVVISRVINEPVIMLATPILDYSGNISAVLIARLDGYVLSDIIDQITYGECGYSYIINGNGALIAHGNREYVLEARNFLEEGKTNQEYALLSMMMQRMVGGETGFDQYRFMGSKRFFGFAPVPGTEWSIAVGAVRDEIFNRVYTLGKITIALFFGYLAVGVIAAILFAGGLVRPIRDVVDILSNVAEGDLTGRTVLKNRDEIGRMGASLNSTINRLSEMVSGIRGNVKKTGGNMMDLLDAMNETRLSTDEINTAMHDVNEAIVNQASVVTEISATIEEITKTIEAQDTKISSQAANVTESSAAIEEMIANIQSIANGLNNNAEEFDVLQKVVSHGSDYLDDLKGIVSSLSKQSESVVEANETIKNIAAQTDLLAMNAAIEAAHAGDAGKGFAVVADEIRKLAEVSNQQSVAISESLTQLKQAIESAVIVSNETGASFQTIVNSVERVTNIEKEIKDSLDEQASGSSQVLQALSDISQVTEEVHAGSGETLTGSKAILQEMAGLVDITETVKNLL